MMIQNPLAIASVSLGQHASHTLPQKILAAGDAGIRGIEITFPDLNSHASTNSLSMLQAAIDTRDLCEKVKLTIISFAPFENFEGQPSPLAERLQTAREWLAIAHALGAEHLQVPSNYNRAADGSKDVITSDLRHLCDLAASYQPAIKIAYENLAWGMHCGSWQQALETVRMVDRENFGLCLDSFHLCAALWGDAFNKTGVQPHGERKLQESLRALSKQLPLEKLFYLQLSDGERLDPPYSTSHPWYEASLEPEHVWSMEARPFPLEIEYGSYMPVAEVAHAFLVELGYTGWVSLETFDRRMRLKAEGPVKNARRAVKSWETLRIRLMDDIPSHISSKL